MPFNGASSDRFITRCTPPLLYVVVITGLNVITPRKCVELLCVYLLSP
ncbi:hypothetical protein D083_0147 [Dickeya solani RNS 08.23.3.1.A]|nr:hypothetical protein D083_0147 [Dickeya solani RNS 08.23.3.1.A]